MMAVVVVAWIALAVYGGGDPFTGIARFVEHAGGQL